MNFVLIGPRGVGKSKVSRALSKKNEFPVLSTDSLASYELGGMSIPAFIQQCQGDWAEFRALEKRILKKLQSADGIILDCGGGILFDVDENGKEFASPEKLELLKKIGKVFCLEKPKSELIAKVLGDKTRPELSKTTAYEVILERRLPVYRQSSDFLIQADKLTKEEIAEKILSLVSLK